jgi:hypothetical protein
MLFKIDAPRKDLLPAALWERVKFGNDIGISIVQPEDYLCCTCLYEDHVFSTTMDDFVCVIHGKVPHVIHKCRVIEYVDQYEEELKERLRKMAEPNSKKQDYGIVKYQSPLEIPAETKALMVRDIMNAGLITKETYGKYAQQAADCAATIALLHGLNPFIKEVSAWPIVKNVQVEGKWTQAVEGFAVHVGYKAYLRVANEEAKRQGNPFFLGKAITLDAASIEQRGANICQNCAGQGKMGKGQNTYQCRKCGGKGRFDPSEVIVVLQPIYLYNEAKLAQSLGLKPEPRLGEGVWQPGDQFPHTRTPWWQAWKRAFTDCFRQAYSLDFSLPPMEGYEPEVVVLSPDEYHGTEQTPVEVEPITESWPEPEVDVIELAGITTDNQDALDALVERMVGAGYDERANVINTMVTLGITEYIAANAQQVEQQLLDFLAQNGEEPTDMDEGFNDKLGGKAVYDAQQVITGYGYPSGRAQTSLFIALFGEGMNIGKATAGQIANATEYARLAHLTKERGKSLAMPKQLTFAPMDEGAYEVEAFKDVLKEICRAFTKICKFWTVEIASEPDVVDVGEQEIPF